MKDIYVTKKGAEKLLEAVRYYGSAPDVVRIFRNGYCFTWIWSNPDPRIYAETATETAKCAGKYILVKPITAKAVIAATNIAEKVMEAARKTAEIGGMLAEFAVWIGNAMLSQAKESAAKLRHNAKKTMRVVFARCSEQAVYAVERGKATVKPIIQKANAIGERKVAEAKSVLNIVTKAINRLPRYMATSFWL